MRSRGRLSSPRTGDCSKVRTVAPFMRRSHAAAEAEAREGREAGLGYLDLGEGSRRDPRLRPQAVEAHEAQASPDVQGSAGVQSPVPQVERRGAPGSERHARGLLTTI